MRTAGTDRWVALTERMVLGEPLSADDREYVETMRRTDATCCAELSFLEGLEGALLDPGPPDASTAAIARAAVELAGQAPSPNVLDDHAPSRRRVWIAAVTAAAAVAAAVALGVGLSPRTPVAAEDGGPAGLAAMPAALTLATGEVYVDGQPATSARLDLVDGSTLAVAEGGAACLAIGDEVDVCLSSSTTVTLRDLAGSAPWVQVQRGHAVAQLDPRVHGERSFGLGNDELRATAIGTIFAVDVADDAVTASVIQGVVRIDFAGESFDLAAHKTVVVRGGVVEQGRLASGADVADLAALRQADRAPGHSRGTVVIDCAPGGAHVRIDGEWIGASPVVALLPAGEHRIEVEAEGRTRVQETLTIEADARVQRRFELPPAVAIATPTEQTPPPALDAPRGPTSPAPTVRVASPAAMIAEARSLRQSGQWKQAARAYDKLRDAHPKSAEAHAALVSLGDLQLDHLGRAKAAARSYGRYLADGGGALALEARYGRVRAYRAVEDEGAEADAIEVFVAAHPSSGRTPMLKRRLGEITAGR